MGVLQVESPARIDIMDIYTILRTSKDNYYTRRSGSSEAHGGELTLTAIASLKPRKSPSK